MAHSIPYLLCKRQIQKTDSFKPFYSVKEKTYNIEMKNKYGSF